MSTPISAMMISAARLPTPVLVAEPVTSHHQRGDHLVHAGVEAGDRGLQVPPGGQAPARPATHDARRSGLAAPGATGGAWCAACPGPAPPGPSGRVPRRPARPASPGPRRPARRRRPRPCLLPASSRVVWMRWHSAPCAWTGPLAVAGQIAQLADGRRGHEAAPQQPTPRAAPHSQAASPTSVLRPGRILVVAGIDQQQRQPALLQHLPAGLPVLPGRLHHHLPDALRL